MSANDCYESRRSCDADMGCCVMRKHLRWLTGVELRSRYSSLLEPVASVFTPTFEIFVQPQRSNDLPINDHAHTHTHIQTHTQTHTDTDTDRQWRQHTTVATTTIIKILCTRCYAARQRSRLSLRFAPAPHPSIPVCNLVNDFTSSSTKTLYVTWRAMTSRVTWHDVT